MFWWSQQNVIGIKIAHMLPTKCREHTRLCGHKKTRLVQGR
nr:MAG TPA: hypothetical protein [Caudoviricetes sp.]